MKKIIKNNHTHRKLWSHIVLRTHINRGIRNMFHPKNPYENFKNSNIKPIE